MQVALKLTPADMLASLYRLRWCAVAFAFIALLTAHFALGLAFALTQLLALTGALAGWNLLVGLRLRRNWAATELEGFAHLAIDTLALSAFLYWGGGSTSPFVSLYLLPIAIAAAALPRGYAWAIAALACGIYSLLLFEFLPLGQIEHGGFAVHVFGMWVTFLIGALLLMVFIAGMAATVRRSDQSLAQAREQMLRNEQVTALGALAAGAAHELGTPLSTMGMLVAELREQRHNADTAAQIETLAQQIALCKHPIDQLLGAAEQARGANAVQQPLSVWLNSVLDRWRLMRPDAKATLQLQPPFSDAPVGFDDSLAQSLINLLNNAADASQENGANNIKVTASCDATHADIIIQDHGKGISAADTARAGRLRFSTKTDGHGLGLVLSHANLERFGGEVSLKPATNGGTFTHISLPLASLPA